MRVHWRHMGAVLLAILSLVFPSTVSGQSCITEMTVISGNSSSIQPPAGYTKIPRDLNQGAGGKYIYLCYKRGAGAPITGIWVTVNSGTPTQGSGWYKIDQDLNEGTTKSGDPFIYLWYTKDPGCETLRGLDIIMNDEQPPPGYWFFNVDLNQGAGGAFIYVCCKFQ